MHRKTPFFLIIYLLLFSPSAHAVIEAADDEWIKGITISLLGRIPSQDEIIEIKKASDAGADFKESCGMAIDYIMSSPGFYKHMEDQLREEYLESVSKNNIIEYVTDFYQLDKGRVTSIYHDYFHREFVNLLQLGSLLKGDFPEDVSIKLLQRLLVDNYVYDQINMGTDNFVLSMFQHFMMRKPTHYELNESKKIIEGNYGTLFNNTGSSKADFLDIFFSSNNYYEGQVRYWYIKVMHEEPDTNDLMQFMPIIHADGSPETLIRHLLIKKVTSFP